MVLPLNEVTDIIRAFRLITCARSSSVLAMQFRAGNGCSDLRQDTLNSDDAWKSMEDKDVDSGTWILQSIQRNPLMKQST